MSDIKLVCFDLDRTLIKQNSWYELNLALGVTHEEDQAMLEEYKRGELPYADWQKKLLILLQRSEHATLSKITEVLSHCYSYIDEGVAIVEYVKSKGYKVALISGSIDILVDLIAQELGIEFAEANNSFVFDSENRLKDIIYPQDDVQAKLNHLETFCMKMGISPEQCVCVGDGDNDVAMFKKTKHGVTFKGSSIEADAWKIIDNLAQLKDVV